MRDLSIWCQDNNLSLNVEKTKEIIVDFRKSKTVQPPVYINDVPVEIVDNFRFLFSWFPGLLVSWSGWSSLLKKEHQRLYFL